MLYQSNDLSLTRDQLFGLINKVGLVRGNVPEDAEVSVIGSNVIHVRWDSDLELAAKAA